MITGFFNLPWFAWAGLALIIAVIYFNLWPQKAVTNPSGFRFVVIRWGHALVWILLTISLALRGFSSAFTGMANIIALAGGLAYVLFLIMTFVVTK